MTLRIRLSLVAALFLAGPAARVRADFVEYDLGSLGKAMSAVAGMQNKALDLGGNTKILLPGTTQVQPGGKLSYTHPNGAKVHFNLEDVKRIKAPTSKEVFNKQFTMAGNDPEAL